MGDHFNHGMSQESMQRQPISQVLGSFTAHVAQGFEMHKPATSVSAEYSLFSSEKTLITVP